MQALLPSLVPTCPGPWDVSHQHLQLTLSSHPKGFVQFSCSALSCSSALWPSACLTVPRLPRPALKLQAPLGLISSPTNPQTQGCSWRLPPATSPQPPGQSQNSLCAQVTSMVSLRAGLHLAPALASPLPSRDLPIPPGLQVPKGLMGGLSEQNVCPPVPCHGDNSSRRDYGNSMARLAVLS